MAHNQSLNIFHGPVSIAGIGGYLADYQKRKGHISDHVVWANLGVHQLQDFSLHTDLFPSKFMNRFIRVSWFFVALAKYDIFHFYYGLSLLPFEIGARCGGGGIPDPIMPYVCGVNQFIELLLATLRARHNASRQNIAAITSLHRGPVV